MPMTKYIVLVVAEHPGHTLIVQKTLAMANLVNPLKIVRSADEAVAYLRGPAPDAPLAAPRIPSLILLDLELAGGAGFEVLEWIRNREGLSRVPTVGMISPRAEAELRGAYDVGIDAHVTKPLGLLDLLEILPIVKMFWMLLSPASPRLTSPSTPSPG